MQRGSQFGDKAAKTSGEETLLPSYSYHGFAARVIKHCMRVNEALSYYLIIIMTGLTVILPSKAPIESLCVNMTDTLTSSSMEKFSFTISAVVVIHFQFSQHVALIKNRILDALDFLDMHSLPSSASLDLAQDILVLRGTLFQLYCMHSVISWHWRPVLWEMDFNLRRKIIIIK